MKVLELAHDVRLLLFYETSLWQVDRKGYTPKDKDIGDVGTPASQWGMRFICESLWGVLQNLNRQWLSNEWF